MSALVAHRRHPLAFVALLLVALLATGMLYAALAPSPADAAAQPASQEDVDAGRELFLANCATCHGLQAQGSSAGPTLIGVGAASVDFQVGTGRMPLQATAPQAPKRNPQFSDEQVAQMSAYVATLAPGPAIPDEEFLVPLTEDDERLAEGNELFRTNCAMCHNVVGSGGALTRGKYAPPLHGVDPKYIYEAMTTGPQSMPVFNDANITPEEKQSIISYLAYVDEAPSPGGISLGSLGPVSEGLFVWVAGLGLLIACAVWLGQKSS